MKGMLWTGIILLVLGLLGVYSNYYVTWMWFLVVLGVIAVLWGWMGKKSSM